MPTTLLLPTSPLTLGLDMRERKTRYIKLSDAELVKLAQSGFQDGFNELVERYHDLAHRKAFAIVKDHQLAEDISQEAFFKVYKKIDAIQDASKFSFWFLRTVQHTALDRRRALKDTLSLEAIREDGFEIQQSDQECLEEYFEKRDEDLRILSILKRLRTDYRKIFELKHIQHKTYREIGNMLDMSVSAVGEKLSRVRQLIKRQLDKLLQDEERRRQERKERSY